MTGELHIRDFAEADLDAVVALWQRAGLTRPHNDPEKDLRFAIAGPSSTVLVGVGAEGIVGTVMVGHDGHRGTIYYLAVDPDHRNLGFGAAMLAGAEGWLSARGLWKINLLIREENDNVRKFYQKCGYLIENRIAMSRRIEKT